MDCSGIKLPFNILPSALALKDMSENFPYRRLLRFLKAKDSLLEV